MKQFVIIILLSFYALQTYGQGYTDSLKNAVSMIWKADPMGKNKQRSKTITYDTATKKIASISGINLLNFTKKQVKGLLGKPNRSTHHGDNLIFDYFLAPHCGFSEEGCYKWVLEINLYNNIVQEFYSSFIKVKQK